MPGKYIQDMWKEREREKWEKEVFRREREREDNI